MHLSESITYDAPPAAVLAMLANPEFHQQVADRSRPLRSTVDARTEPDGTVVARIERTQSADDLSLPSVVKLDEITFVQEQRWAPAGPDGAAQGTVTVEVQGLPVRFDGTLTLVAEGTGSRETLEGDLVAKIPLVGGKVEKSAAPAVLAAVRAESSTGAAWLSSH